MIIEDVGIGALRVKEKACMELFKNPGIKEKPAKTGGFCLVGQIKEAVVSLCPEETLISKRNLSGQMSQSLNHRRAEKGLSDLRSSQKVFLRSWTVDQTH